MPHLRDDTPHAGRMPLTLPTRVRRGWIRWLSLDLGAGIIALAELVTVLPAVILIQLGAGVPGAFLLALGAGALAFWLARIAIELPVELWRSS